MQTHYMGVHSISVEDDVSTDVSAVTCVECLDFILGAKTGSHIEGGQVVTTLYVDISLLKGVLNHLTEALEPRVAYKLDAFEFSQAAHVEKNRLVGLAIEKVKKMLGE